MNTLCRIILLAMVLASSAFGQDRVRIYQKPIKIPTYLVSEPDKSPYFYTGTAYQGAQKRVYPYAFDGNLTDQLEDVTYVGLFLENEYLKICVLPELGGRLYYMIDKTNGYNVIYRNNVIKPSMIGMLGAWISGGTEWNVPHHHRASTFMPTDYELVENGDGSKTIWVGELELRHQIRWMVGLTMSPGRSVLKVDLKYINQTPITQSFLIWANTAIHTNENYQVIYPPLTQFAVYHGKNDFVQWPEANKTYRGYTFTGQDISYWKNIPAGGSFFAWEDQGRFVAGIDHGENAGICIVGDPSVVVGKKLWTWGTSPRAKMWDQILSDADGPYLEIMTGAFSNNQPDYSWCAPYFTKEATMYFMPLQGLSGVKESSLKAAVNFEVSEAGKMLVEAHAYEQAKNAQLTVLNGETVVWQEQADLHPAKPKRWEVPIGTHSFYDLSLVVKDNSGETLVEYQPQRKGNDPLPETVKPPKTPTEIETVEEVALAGLRLQQIYNPAISPLPYYQEALQREPDNAFANTRAGAWFLKQGMFGTAEHHLNKAARRWSIDYTRPRNAEAFYLLGLAQTAQGKEGLAQQSFETSSWDYAWHGASHLQLAQIYSRRGQYKTALEHIEKSISVNAKNVRAMEIRMTLLRKLGRQDQITNILSQNDPLNLYSSAEDHFLGRTGLHQFTGKMRGEIQNYIDLAVKYINLGLFDEATRILEVSLIQDHALTRYYLGYLYQKLELFELSSRSFKKASQLSTDYVFPFRFETEVVLQQALKQNPEDDKAWYYWGNLLYDHQPEKAIAKWEQAVSINPDFAMAHRNLGFAYYHHHNDASKAAQQMALAIQNDPSQPLYYFEQDNYALMLGEKPDSRLNKLNQGLRVIRNSDNPLARKVFLDLVCGEVDDALEILQKHHFRKVEGVGNIHNVWVDAWLLKGRAQLAAGDTRSAVASFEKTLEYPRNLEIGENDREGQSHYFIGLAHKKAGHKAETKAHFQKAIEQPHNGSIEFYKGRALEEVGRKNEARQVFEGLVQKAESQIQRGQDTDYFAKFGDREAPNVILAEAYSTKGLGLWGLGKKEQAEEAFSKALDSDPSNFVAKTRLFE